MTELSEKNVPYEILIRLDEDGLSGAHYQTRHVVSYGDRLLKNELNMPIPLSLVDDPADKMTLTAALGEMTAQAFIALDQARHRIAALEHELMMAREKMDHRQAALRERHKLAMRHGH